MEDEGNSNEGDQGDGNDQGNDTFRQSELRLDGVLVSITITVLILLENVVVDAVVTSRLEEDIDGVRNDEENRDDARDHERLVFNALYRNFRWRKVCRGDAVFENSWNS